MATEIPTKPEIELGDLPGIFSGFAEHAKQQMEAEYTEPIKKVLVLAGPTATGKTEFGIDVAKRIGGEIVSADSMQTYVGMDIGTAKPSLQMRAMVPHHLIDSHQLDEPLNVADFYEEARECCQVISLKNRIPVVVGGSGFYLHSLIYGPPSGPPSIPEIKKEIEKELAEKGIDALFEKLRKLDPHYAATITKGDRQKIVRALEIIQLSGKPVSRHSWKGKKHPQYFEFHCWFLYRPKSRLDDRINLRCEEMLQAGLLEEVACLKSKGLEANTSASQAIGYRQALEYLRSDKSDVAYKKFIHDFKKASRRYAKRQFTWFKREPLFRWLDLDLHDRETARDMVLQDLDMGL